MTILKTKDAAKLLAVSMTTIKRWAAMFPNFFPKDRFGHYTFSEQQISMLSHIKDQINLGEPLESIHLDAFHDEQMSISSQENPIEPSDHEPMSKLLTRMDHIERTLEQKADEVVMFQLLQQRKELEELRLMIKEVAAALEPIQKTSSQAPSTLEASPSTAASRLPAPPRKRSLLRSFFSLL